MSTGTNKQRITTNNGIISDNNDDLTALKTRINNLPDTSVATATASDIALNKTAFANGQLITGTKAEPTYQSKTATPSTSQQVIEPDSNYNGLSSVTVNAVTSSIDSNITAGNIKKNVTILGVTGTVDEGIDTSDATAVAGDIAENKTAYVDGQKVTGNVHTIENGRTCATGLNNITEGNTTIMGFANWILSTLFKSGSKIQATMQKSDIATAINLQPSDIRTGSTVLGVQGTCTPGTDTSDADATAINIRSGKTAYVNGQKITGTLPVLTYPVNPLNPSDWDYQFIASSGSLKQVTRDNVQYVLGSYQIASESQPDSWEFEGNRKMKMGFPVTQIRTLGGISASKIKKGETIFGVSGTVNALVGQTKTVTPTTSQQTITPDTNYNGLTQVTIGAVDNTIDSNIVAGNIKKDVSILGVTGTYETPSASAEAKDVNFYDYDGTLVNSYAKAEFLALNAMPENPAHTGLTSQGWNWSLTDAKTYVTKNNKLNIGQMYITDDGKTRIYITLQNGRLNPTLSFGINGSATVNWGDGTTSTVTGTNQGMLVGTPHNYAVAGSYVITIDSNVDIEFFDATLLLGNGVADECYSNSIKRVELGSNITYISGNAFATCRSLSSITIPNNVIDISDYAFSECSSLSSITIPNSVTIIRESAFDSCRSLSNITLPNSITDISDSIFNNCSSLSDITIPDSVTDIGDWVFFNCMLLSDITIPDSVTNIGNTAFRSCSSLSSITIPDSVTSIGSTVFSDCVSLSDITIPDSVTSIGDYAFEACRSLSSITIPGSVTSIGDSAFDFCAGIAYYDFTSSTTIPTLNGEAFADIATDCKIIVPDNLYDDWIEEINWSTYVDYIVKASDYANQ